MKKPLAIVGAIALVLAGVLAVVMFTGSAGQNSATGLCGPGQSLTPVAAIPEGMEVAGYSGEQLANASAIITEGARKGLDARGQTIGVMTAMGESGLRVLDYGDGPGPDSRGLFQQRDNGAWGTYADRMDPTRSAGMFFDKLLTVEGWQQLAPTIAAHRVQRNADPLHYEDYWEPAVAVVTALSTTPSPGGATPPPGDTLEAAERPTDDASTPAPTGRTYDLGPVKPHAQAMADEVGTMFELAPGDVGGWRASAVDRNGHPAGLAIDFMTYENTALGDSIVAYLVQNADRLSVDYIIWKQAIWRAADAGKGWVAMTDRGSDTANHLDHPHVNVTPEPSAAAGLGAPGCLSASLPGPGGVATGAWITPLDAPLTSPYGPRWGSFHNGVDFGAPCGTPIYAAGDGVVTYTGNGHAGFGLSGHVVVLDHGGGIQTAYNHMYANGIGVRVGQNVAAGDAIARVGNDGNSTGCHLHFSTWVNGDDVNPVPFMQQLGITLGA